MSDGNEPYKAEYAKSGRSSCKGCKSPIAQGEFRLAVMVQSSHFDGKVPYWFHSSCFFNKHKPKAIGDICKFDGLRVEDQKFVMSKISAIYGSPEPEASGSKGKGKKAAAKRKSAGKISKGVFKVEYSVSNRAVCIGCEQKIVQGDVRCAKMDFESEKAVRFGGIPRWYHLTCFKECRPDTEFWDSDLGCPCGCYDVWSSGGLPRMQAWLLVLQVSDFMNSTYNCGGEGEWAACAFKTDDPPRKAFKVQKKFKEQYDFLASFKGKVAKRIMLQLERSEQASDNVQPSVSTSIKVNRPRPPLDRMYFVVNGQLSKPLKELRKDITRLGGSVVSEINEMTMALIADKAAVKKGTGKKITEAEAYNIHIVPEDFLEAAKGKTNDQVKLTMKNGAYVDPDSGLDKRAHVYKEGKDLYTAKQPGKYMLMDLDMGQDKTQGLVSLEKAGIKSNLPTPVQDLLDLEKMPLGKLSERQIREAFGELAKLQNAVHDVKNPSKALITASTNRFYTLIPHCVGTSKLPMLDNEEIIKSKLDMLESLLEMEVAYGMMKTEGKAESSEVHPVDQQYSKLKTTITVLDKQSEEFGHLQAYVRNTHAETHQQYELDIQEVFKVERQGEGKRYKPWKKLPNRKLLWHGSRLTNFAGILSNAPVTGYMFGKGIYFADMVSKSANYCFTTKKNNTGLLLLCEFYLFFMLLFYLLCSEERTQADYIESLPKGKHSVKGVGQTHPDPEHTVVLPHGVEVPLGPPAKSNVQQTSLLYNEYIVYDASQVKIEYLLKLNFKYKY
ncbi:hypothetical protein B566_EDAN009390 [Ephemera danica]|nr:hypothetical protein B566_EDAN009390 [Ephemera danica]